MTGIAEIWYCVMLPKLEFRYILQMAQKKVYSSLLYYYENNMRWYKSIWPPWKSLYDTWTRPSLMASHTY